MSVLPAVTGEASKTRCRAVGWYGDARSSRQSITSMTARVVEIKGRRGGRRSLVRIVHTRGAIPESVVPRVHPRHQHAR